MFIKTLLMCSDTSDKMVIANAAYAFLSLILIGQW